MALTHENSQNPYRPVSCDFHDELESLSTLRKRCIIRYNDNTGDPVEVQGQIVDVYTDNKEEFVKLTGGEVIRLDRIIEVREAQPL